MRGFTILMLLASTCLGAVAQTAARPAASQPVFSTQPEQQRLEKRIADLNPPEKGLPRSSVGLVEERHLLETELQGLRYLSESSARTAAHLEDIAKARADVSTAMGDVAKADCAHATSDNFVAGQRLNAIFYDLPRRLQSAGFDYGLWEGAPWDSDRLTAQRACTGWKAFIGNDKKQAALMGYFDDLTTRTQTEVGKQEALARSANQLADLLQKRLDFIDKSLSTQETKSQLSDRLWLLVVVISCFSIAAIMAVRLFEPRIQLEWVASGQVIQFVTVMILLSVIMALGLAEILKENTLGTLLGGIGGYVLAQGVGRAAAREVSRSNSERPPV